MLSRLDPVQVLAGEKPRKHRMPTLRCSLHQRTTTLTPARPEETQEQIEQDHTEGNRICRSCSLPDTTISRSNLQTSSTTLAAANQ